MREASDTHGGCRPAAALIGLTAALLLAASPCTTVAQAGFQIVWVIIGEAATVDEKRAARVGRQLFLASDLLSMSLGNTRVERVDIEPVIIEIGVDEHLCLSSLTMRAYGRDRRQIDGAPLSISIRQDHKERLSLKRSRRDICMQPSDAGEFPIRLTSLLPAADGTMRGAQVFLRVKDISGAEQSADTR